ncbi:MAG: hypothetical protein IIX82_03915 [Alistipes sp.]|nr:hypothetical protein [Alistipes sp.]
MTKRIVFIIAFLLLSSKAFGESKLAIPERDTLPTKSERLYLDLAFGFDFDNTEYLGSDLGVSETLFGISLAPSLRYEWNEKHSLAVGASAQKWFGSKRFVDDIKLVAYYKFKSPRFTALTGLFPRNELIGDYSEVFFTSIWKTKNNLVQGATLQYTDKFGFAELAIDWNGMYSAATREQFRILFSGEGRFAKVMYAGATAEMQHYSNRADFRFNAVDHITINPYLGVGFKAFFDFDIRLGYLLSLQQDRMANEGWHTPMGGELTFRMSRWGGIHLKQPLCRQKSSTSLPLGWYGGYNIWPRPLRLRPLLRNNNRHIQPHRYRVCAELLEGTHKCQGRDGIEDYGQASIHPADCVVGRKPLAKTI